MKSYTFKPLFDIHFYVYTISLIIAGILTICLVVPFLIIKDYSAFFIIIPFLLSAYIIPLVLFFCVRCSFKYVISVNENSFTKTRNGKVIFQINKSDIKEVYMKKANFFSYLKFVITTGSASFKATSLFSIVYEKCEVEGQSRFAEKRSLSLKKDKSQNEKEYVDSVTLKQCIMICNIMGIEFKSI